MSCLNLPESVFQPRFELKITRVQLRAMAWAYKRIWMFSLHNVRIQVLLEPFSIWQACVVIQDGPRKSSSPSVLHVSLANVLISVFTLWYGPGLLFLGPPCTMMGSEDGYRYLQNVFIWKREHSQSSFVNTRIILRIAALNFSNPVVLSCLLSCDNRVFVFRTWPIVICESCLWSLSSILILNAAIGWHK